MGEGKTDGGQPAEGLTSESDKTVCRRTDTAGKRQG